VSLSVPGREGRPERGGTQRRNQQVENLRPVVGVPRRLKTGAPLGAPISYKIGRRGHHAHRSNDAFSQNSFL